MKNVVWHVAVDPDTKQIETVIAAELEVDDVELISMLLSTDRLKGKTIETNDGGFLLMYGGEYERPLPEVMIWRFENEGGGRRVKDMREEDYWIVEYVWREWLMPEGAEVELKTDALL